MRLAQPRAYVAAPESDGSEYSELDKNRQIENGNAIDDRNREVQYVAKHGDEQHSCRWQQQRADGDDKDVKRGQLRRCTGLGDVHDRRDEEKVEQRLQVIEAVGRQGLSARRKKNRSAGEEQRRDECERRHQGRAGVGSPPDGNGGDKDRRGQAQAAEVQNSKDPLPPSTARSGKRKHGPGRRGGDRDCR